MKPSSPATDTPANPEADFERHCYTAAAALPMATAGVCALEDAALAAMDTYPHPVDPALAASYRDNPWFQLHLATCYTQASLGRVQQRWQAAGLGQVPGTRMFPLAVFTNATQLERPYGGAATQVQDQCFWGVYGILWTLLEQDSTIAGPICSRSRLPDPPLALVDALTAAYLQGYASGSEGSLSTQGLRPYGPPGHPALGLAPRKLRGSSLRLARGMMQWLMPFIWRDPP